MKTLGIDIETYSDVDLKTGGVYKYVESPNFEILLFAVSIDGADPVVYDLAQDEFSIDHIIVAALTDPNVTKTAHNAAFERVCIAKYFSVVLPPEQWECTMVKSAMVGLPMALDAVAKALKLDEVKNADGKALIRYFCMPCKPTKANGERTRNLPTHDLEKWARFCEYCRQDVVVEQLIRETVKFFEIPVMEQQLWALDQKINDTGVMLDPVFVLHAIAQDIAYKERLTEEALKITQLDNPNSPAQLKAWLTEETGDEVTSLKKADVTGMLKGLQSDTAKRVLEIRQEMSKTSVKKYAAMRNVIGIDNRVRGLFQYYGAGRTGRWAGRLLQPHNFPKNNMKLLDVARQLVVADDLEMLEAIFGNVPDVLSQLIRTALVAGPGNRFIVADFKAIEAVVIAWLAGERWRMDVFRTHGRIYEASAAKMFKVDINSITYKTEDGKTHKGENYDLRAKGKIAELALGYQGAVAALLKMGALEMGLIEEELPRIVKMWRNENKMIVQFWKDAEDAVIRAVQGETVTIQYGIKFFCSNDVLFIQLPSGRRLSYMRPRIKTEMFVFVEFLEAVGKYKVGQKAYIALVAAQVHRTKNRAKITSDPIENHSVTYEGMNQTTKKWESQDTYGGKIVENIVQAVARDCLGVALLRIDAAGYKIVMHVHDEIVNEVPVGTGSAEEIDKLMSEPIPWAPGLPLSADSYETEYYKKD